MRIHHALALSVLAVMTALPAVGCNRSRATTPQDKKPSPWLAEKTAKPRDGQASPDQEAMMRVLDADQNQFKGGFDAMKPNSQPSAVKAMVAAYAEQLEKVDLNGCPGEFAAAHQRHAKAWRMLQAAINRLPDAYQGDEFMNSLYSLFHDDGKNGRTLGGDVIKTVQRVNETYAEVYTSAESYGIAFDSK